MVKRKPKRAWWNIPGHILAMTRTRDGRSQLGLYVSVTGVFLSACGLIDRVWLSPDEVTPEAARFGWNEMLAAKEAPLIAAQTPKFAITDENGDTLSGAGKNAELWKFTKLANGGKHVPCWKQESGDCVSMGATTAETYRMGYQIGREQRNEVLKIPFPPYTYGGSRVTIGRGQLGRQPGSVGAWAAQFAQSHGIYTVDQAALDGYTYSGRLADQWGQTGPPKKAVEFGRKFRIRSVAQVKSWNDVRDALVHGYPVTVASNVGFNGGSYDRDGKRWLQPRGNWGHQMCFIGVEDRPGRQKGAYCQNSWGADAHPKPLNDEPPGGFWVDWQTVHKMVGQGDSWAFSDFDGFPSTDSGADWNAFKLEAVETEEDAAEVAQAEQPEPTPVLLETRKMFPVSLLAVALIAFVGIGVASLIAKYGWSPGTKGTALILIAIVGIGATADAGHRRKMARMQMQQSTGTVCVNGRCPTGYIPSATKPADQGAGLPADMKPAEANTESFNAFGPMPVESKPANVWTAWPTGKHLRTYADCYEHETDFVLVIGPEEAALHELETADKPVAHEVSHNVIEPGSYHIHLQGGQLVKEPLAKSSALHVSTVRVRRDP